MENKKIKWLWKSMIRESHLHSTTKAICQTLADQMQEDGSKCFPSVKKISHWTRFSERTVCTHLEIAEKNGWLKVEVAGINGKGWKLNKYIPLIPDKALKEIQYEEVEGTEPLAEGTEPNDIKALKEVQSTNKDTNKKTKKTFSSDSTEYRLSEKLFLLIQKRNSNHKKPNFQTWCKDIDKMLRLDNRSPQEIEKVIEWCQADNFWKNNILSTFKLRDKFDQLFLKTPAVNNKQSNPHNPTGVVV